VGYEIENSTTTTGIGLGCKNARRFVENDPEITGGSIERLTVYSDLVAFGVDALPRDRNLSIDFDSTCRDKLFRATARSNARSRESALNAHHFRHQAEASAVFC